MTAPDALEKQRNSLAALGALFVSLSAFTAYAANIGQTAFDYWLIWAAIASGAASVILLGAAIFAHCARIEELRDN